MSVILSYPPPATALNFIWTTGTPFTYTFVMRDPSGRRLNLTGYSAAMQLRAAASDTTPLAALSTESGHITLDAAAGEVTVAVSTAAILGIAWTSALYDLLLIDPQDRESRLYSGTVTVAAGVTRVESGVSLPTSVTLITPAPPLV